MRLRLLGKSGLRVSELCLGTMTFGEDWGWGADKPTAGKIFDRFATAGGNFIDTSCNYTDGTAEKFVGEFIHAERDRYVVATKYTLRLNSENTKNANLGGNSRKAMLRSVEGSLRRLQTDYIDLLYLHMWDGTTPVEEVLRGVDDLVRAGKVMYFAFSDTPAWVITYAIAKAEDYMLTRPVAIQFPYSLLGRSPENDILPMAREHDLALLPWGLLEGGVLTGKYSQTANEPRREENPDPRDVAAGDAVVKLAKEIGASPAQVAINWVRQQRGNVIPILGCRSEHQIEDNLGCLNFTLTPPQIDALNQISGFRLGFPYSFLRSPMVNNLVFGDTYTLLDNHHDKA
jgi:aryl-alcohol dehydrogenase-like predicted oxidoreductase